MTPSIWVVYYDAGAITIAFSKEELRQIVRYSIKHKKDYTVKETRYFHVRGLTGLLLNMVEKELYCRIGLLETEGTAENEGRNAKKQLEEYKELGRYIFRLTDEQMGGR